MDKVSLEVNNPWLGLPDVAAQMLSSFAARNGEDIHSNCQTAISQCFAVVPQPLRVTQIEPSFPFNYVLRHKDANAPYCICFPPAFCFAIVEFIGKSNFFTLLLFSPTYHGIISYYIPADTTAPGARSPFIFFGNLRPRSQSLPRRRAGVVFQFLLFSRKISLICPSV